MNMMPQYKIVLIKRGVGYNFCCLFKERSICNLSVWYRNIGIEELRQTKATLSQQRQGVHRDANQAPTEHRSATFLLEQRVR
jgi:hypothetical protein